VARMSITGMSSDVWLWEGDMVGGFGGGELVWGGGKVG
jgi:hypothetical protein